MDAAVEYLEAHAADVAKLQLRFHEADGFDEPDEKVDRYRERLDRVVAAGEHRVLVARGDDGEPIGYIAAQDYGPAAGRDWSIARIHDLWVVPDARGRGIGSQLFTRIRSWAEHETRIRFLEWQSSAVAQDFYEKLGLSGSVDGDPKRARYELEVHLPGSEPRND